MTPIIILAALGVKEAEKYILKKLINYEKRELLNVSLK